jgi:hypothetical protein
LCADEDKAMPDRFAALPLSEPQERSLVTGVRHLLDLLAQLQTLLVGDPTPTAAHVIVDDLDEGVALAAQRLLQTAVAQVEVLSELVGATPSHQSRRGLLSAVASSAWATAEDLHPRQLRAYGAVDPAVSEALAPVVERLADTLLRVASLMNDSATVVDAHVPDAERTAR